VDVVSNIFGSLRSGDQVPPEGIYRVASIRLS
jgi:hypothetical protein